MNFPTLFWQLLQSNQSYSSALRSSFNPDNLSPEKTPIPQAYSQARKKIHPRAFTAVDKLLPNSYYKSINPNFKNFCGFRAIGVDGSNMRLEDSAYN
ncbi:hypothetical protein PQO03_01380 [Lentisphaera profundi]|uniref:Uncharacterized protein n=1 Tax=Lentisphaera profundi TaxID=1658616 RepID=A0ABY7VSA5_9BACT|nr:hypothetical protein [Lentisphaera profundi]WDE96619.1 hypothetical protein PQO03_01380 [Lentisphaera profundi]